jgi:hypothetical protein
MLHRQTSLSLSGSYFVQLILIKCAGSPGCFRFTRRA